jgi:hypothetical protein
MLTYKGRATTFAPWATSPGVQFGQLLIRIATASRAVGAHDAKLARMDDWLNTNELDPRWQERFRKREEARLDAVRLRTEERRQMAESINFLHDRCPDLASEAAKLQQLLHQFGGQWPADPEHFGEAMRRVTPDQLGSSEAPF